jgi:hypothetical protein
VSAQRAKELRAKKAELEATYNETCEKLDAAIRAEEEDSTKTIQPIQYDVDSRRVREVALKSGNAAAILEARKHPHGAGPPQVDEDDTNDVNKLINKAAAEGNLNPKEIVALIQCYPRTGGAA